MKINGPDIGLDWRCAVYLRGVLRNNDITEYLSLQFDKCLRYFCYIKGILIKLEVSSFAHNAYCLRISILISYCL